MILFIIILEVGIVWILEAVEGIEGVTLGTRPWAKSGYYIKPSCGGSRK